MTEKPLQKEYIRLLNILKLPFVHINNRGQRSGVYRDSSGQPCTKNFPDLMFAYNGKVYQREFGIKGAHLDRKAKQMSKMEWWCVSGGVDILIINNRDGMKEDWRNIGLTV